MQLQTIRRALLRVMMPMLSCATAFLGQNVSFAQVSSGTPVKLTLSQAIDLALKQNRTVQLAHLAVSDSEHKKEIARSAYYPHIKNESSILHVTELAGVAIPAGAFGVPKATGAIPETSLFIGQGSATGYTSGTGLAQPLTQMFRIRESNRAATADEAEVLIATRLTTPVREALIAGRKVLLVANSSDALIDPERKLPLNDRHNFPSMLLRERAGTPWDGQWMGAFTWRRMEGPWSSLPGGPMLDEHWSGLLPNHVLTGFPSTAFGGLVDAGVAVGWLHHAAAFVKRSFLGKGWLTVSTFDLTSPQAHENPLAPHLMKALAES